MKDYTSVNPVFSTKIRIVETTDPAHADNVNAAPRQLLQNTLANRAAIMALAGSYNWEYDAENESLRITVPGSGGEGSSGGGWVPPSGSADIQSAAEEAAGIISSSLDGVTGADVRNLFEGDKQQK